MARILFVAALKNPERLQRDREKASEVSREIPLFPIGTRQYFWAKVLKKRGHEVSVFWHNMPDFESRSKQSTQSGGLVSAVINRLPITGSSVDVDTVNQMLRQHAQKFQPEIIWIEEDNKHITADTLKRIKDKIGSRIIYASGWSPIIFSHEVEREAAKLYDLVLVNDFYHGMQWRELGARDMACLPLGAIDPDYHFPRQVTKEEQQSYGAYVTFIGRLNPKRRYTERIAALNAMREFNVAVWTDSNLPVSLRPNRRGSAYGEKAMRVMASSGVTINVHGDTMLYGGHERLFEAAGIGAFQITNERPGNSVWFTEGVNLVVYRGIEDLREKILYYLNHVDERNSIIAAARRHVLTKHTYEHRLRDLEVAISEW